MEGIGILIQKIMEMFLLMAFGFVLYRRKILSDQGVGDIGKLLSTVVIPLVLLNSMWGGRSAEKTQVLLSSAAVSVVLLALSCLVAVLLFRRDGISAFSVAFSNAGFIGIPLVQSILGSDGAFYISATIALIGILQYTVGIVMITGDRNKAQPAALLKNSVVLSVAAGLLLYALDLPKPALVASVFGSIGSLNTPLAMVLLGVYLARADLKKVFTVGRSYLVSGARLLLVPLLGLLVLRALPFQSEIELAVLIAMAAPAGSLGAIFAQQYGGDVEKATGQVCISTLLCMLTIPLVVALAG